MIILSIPLGFALKGVGIKWTGQSAYVEEKTSVCLDFYGLYNPWDEDINAKLGVSKDLQNVIRVKGSENVFLKANTPNTESTPFKLCFDIPKVYQEEDCLVGGFICEQTCSLGEVQYKGEVIATGSGIEKEGGSGSTADVSASVPLEIRIKCNQHGRSYAVVYIGVLILLVVIVGILYSKKRNR